MPVWYRDHLFAPVDADLHLERIAGGNETEVYCTDDRRYVVKVKSEDAGPVEDAVAAAHAMRTAADGFATAVGSEHSIPNHFIIAANSHGEAQPLIIQPYYCHAQPLFAVNYAALDRTQRMQITRQLLRIIRRSVLAYLKTGRMPDIYGRTSANHSERKRLNAWYMLPWRLWSFIVKRNVLRSHNLMLTGEQDYRIILVDYDPVRRGRLYQWIYYNIRLALFLRDLLLIWIMVQSGYVPRA